MRRKASPRTCCTVRILRVPRDVCCVCEGCGCCCLPELGSIPATTTRVDIATLATSASASGTCPLPVTTRLLWSYPVPTVVAGHASQKLLKSLMVKTMPAAPSMERFPARATTPLFGLTREFTSPRCLPSTVPSEVISCITRVLVLVRVSFMFATVFACMWLRKRLFAFTPASCETFVR